MYVFLSFVIIIIILAALHYLEDLSSPTLGPRQWKVMSPDHWTTRNFPERVVLSHYACGIWFQQE